MMLAYVMVAQQTVTTQMEGTFATAYQDMSVLTILNALVMILLLICTVRGKKLLEQVKMIFSLYICHINLQKK